MFSSAIMIMTNSSIPTIQASTSSGSERRVSKTLTIFPIPMLSPRKSSTTSKPP